MDRKNTIDNPRIIIGTGRAVLVASVLGLMLAGCAADATGDGMDPDRTEPDGLSPGVTFGADSLEFRVYSSRATHMELEIFVEPVGASGVMRQAMTHDPATNMWSLTLATGELEGLGIGDHVYYGYRAWGPNWEYVDDWKPGSAAGFISDVDGGGNRFNPNKLLIDPYAREISHDPTTRENPNATVYASGAAHRDLDTGPVAPKSIAFRPDEVDIGIKPNRPFKDEIIYEVHVRGLTKNDPSIPAEYRGTYVGAGLKAADLAALGVSAVELLPVQETLNDQNDATLGSTDGDNYWGYMTINYFAPDRRYAYDSSPGAPTREFKEMVQAFHAVGIKVYIDVVYNHTSEGGVYRLDGEDVQDVYSYRGLDNVTYYSLTADRQQNYDNTGVGGNFNTYNPVVQKLIIDSLRYWRDEMGVDGYRFDLASVLGNTCEHDCFRYDKMDPGTALNRIWRELPPRPAGGGAGVDLIAEPWAIGEGTYQVGNFPAGWAEWNGMFRDTVRADQNLLGIEAVTPGDLARRVAGSDDLYGDDGRKPGNSVNFIVAHDGFTMKDLYSCNSKNNTQSWPYGPSDGGEEHNRSWDQGGDLQAQRRAARTGLGLLMLSAGAPMITGGDEFLRTQYCNNNVYNLDSDKNWLNYTLTADQQTFRTYAQRLIAFRQAHPALRPAGFYSGIDGNGNGMEQLRWFTPAGVRADAAYFDDANNHALSWRIDGSELGDPAAAIYVAYNGWPEDVSFMLPWPGSDKQWYRVTDTCAWAEGGDQMREPGSEEVIGPEGYAYRLCGGGLSLMIAR